MTWNVNKKGDTVQYVQTDKAPAAIGPYSQAVIAGNLAFTSGQIALTPEGEMLQPCVEAQTRQVLANLAAVLAEAGSSLQQVVKTTIYLADMEDFATVNGIYEAAFAGHKPARSTVAVRTLPKNALVEIDAVALIG